MSFPEWIKMEHPEEETYVYDQHCTNCRYFYWDVNDEKVSRRPICHNARSEYCHKNSPTLWCWAWKKGKKQQCDNLFDPADYENSADPTVSQEVAANARVCC